MYTVVIDTNILIAATEDLMNAAREVINLVIKGEIKAFASRSILDENRTLLQQRVVAAAVRRELQDYFMKVVLVRQVRKSMPMLCEDPEDEKFVQCVRAVEPEYLITQDRHLLDLEDIGTTHVVTPQEFLSNVKRAQDPFGRGEWAGWVKQLLKNG
ncbi:MAG: putative toxin-antitoxin system toxin component, PIN family [Patescibacteria group bacterium]